MSTGDGLVQRLWNCCNVLRDDGLSYGDLEVHYRHVLIELGKRPGMLGVVLPQAWI